MDSVESNKIEKGSKISREQEKKFPVKCVSHFDNVKMRMPL